MILLVTITRTRQWKSRWSLVVNSGWKEKTSHPMSILIFDSWKVDPPRRSHTDGHCLLWQQHTHKLHEATKPECKCADGIWTLQMRNHTIGEDIIRIGNYTANTNTWCVSGIQNKRLKPLKRQQKRHFLIPLMGNWGEKMSQECLNKTLSPVGPL